MVNQSDIVAFHFEALGPESGSYNYLFRCSELALGHLDEMGHELRSETGLGRLRLKLSCIPVIGIGGDAFKGVDGNLLEVNHILQHLDQFFGILLDIWLRLQEVLSLVTECESCKHKGLNWLGEVPVLRFLAVLVHHVPDDIEL